MKYPCFAKLMDITRENYLSSLLLVLALAILSLSACNNSPEGSAPVTKTAGHEENPPAATEGYPEYNEEVPAAGNGHTDSAEEAPVAKNGHSDYAEEAPVAKNGHRDYAEEAPAGAGDGHPEYEEAAPAMAAGADHGETAAAANGGGQGTMQADGLDEYKVVLAADKQMKIPGLPGELKVWIGSPDYKPAIPAHMAEAETTLPAVGESATVAPYAPSFDVDPAETQCIKIHPTGSEVRFTLTPKKAGTFEVGANVFLFNSPDCSGAPVPKTPASLSVTVQVDQKEMLRGMGKELWDVFWAKLLEFWGALLALVFALFLFLIRGKLKKWFGFKDT